MRGPHHIPDNETGNDKLEPNKLSVNKKNKETKRYFDSK